MTPSRPAVMVPMFALFALASIVTAGFAPSPRRRAARKRRESDHQVLALHPELFLLAVGEIHGQDHAVAAGAALGNLGAGDVRVAAAGTPILQKRLERIAFTVGLAGHPEFVGPLVVFRLQP